MIQFGDYFMVMPILSCTLNPSALKHNAPSQRVGGYSLINQKGLLIENPVINNNLRNDLSRLSEFVVPNTDTFKNAQSLVMGSDPYQEIANRFLSPDATITGHFTDAMKNYVPMPQKSLTKFRGVVKGIAVEDSPSYNFHLSRFKNALESHRVPLIVLPKQGKSGANLHFPEGGLQFNKEQALKHGSTIRSVITSMMDELA
jgi:hypothetical protein